MLIFQFLELVGSKVHTFDYGLIVLNNTVLHVHVSVRFSYLLIIQSQKRQYFILTSFQIDSAPIIQI